MKCIICRKDFDGKNVIESDEHVFPGPTGGYYHVYNVCRSCNNRLERIADVHLTDSNLMKLCRYIHKIRGKKSRLPDLLDSRYKNAMQSGLVKVNLTVDEAGELDYRLINYVDLDQDKGLSAVISDIRNAKAEKEKAEAAAEESMGAASSGTGRDNEIDTKKYLLGFLKIAYEFACDEVPSYFDDEEAASIAGILSSGKITVSDAKKIFAANGINKKATECMSFLGTTKNKTHYIVLVSGRTIGLQCYMVLFNTFYIGVRLSSEYYPIKDEMIIGINDIERHSFFRYSVYDYFGRTFLNTEVTIFTEKNQQVDYYRENNKIPVFYSSGDKAYEDIMMIPIKRVKYRDLAEPKIGFVSKVIMPGRLFYVKDSAGELKLIRYYYHKLAFSKHDELEKIIE
ncbi:HNH endonuclease [Schwartzia sp. (in: firmicutes)]